MGHELDADRSGLERFSRSASGQALMSGTERLRWRKATMRWRRRSAPPGGRWHGIAEEGGGRTLEPGEDASHVVDSATGIAEALGDFEGRAALDEESTQRLEATVQGLVGAGKELADLVRGQGGLSNNELCYP